MHARFDLQGLVCHVGPTLAKMGGTAFRPGAHLLDVVEIRDARLRGIEDLLDHAGRRIPLALAAAPDLPMRGVVARLPERSGAILDLSLGISFRKAVARFDLTMSDFSPCDQTVELLYLQEANAAIGRLSKQLTERLARARAAAELQAHTDPLTDLANRRAMDVELDRLLADPTMEFALLHIDLDLFKQVNDRFGHAAGDAVLQAVASVLRTETRAGDTAARVGGDEFLIALRDTTDPEALGAAATRLIAGIARPVAYMGEELRVSASIGIAPTTAYRIRPSAERLVADADAALYRAKEAGRDGYAFHAVGITSSTEE